MRIGIDARFFGSMGKGLGRYTQKLIENLEGIDKENQYFVFLRKENFEEYKPKNPNFKKVLADYKWYGLSEQIFFPILLFKYNLCLVHFPHFNVPVAYRKKIIITIHDLILIHFPTIKNTTLNPLFYSIKFMAYRLVIGSAIRRAHRIITVSDFTKKDILSNYKTIDKDRIYVTHEACENFCFFSTESGEEILKKYGIIKPYLLYVGNAYPHKNLEFLAEAFHIKNSELESVKLVLVGKHDYFYSRLKDFVVRKDIQNVIFPGFIPDSDLDHIYRHCEAFVFPSLYEGFGLPPLEAMSKGAPVLSSDHECMREILQESALFADARNAENFSVAITRILKDKELRENLIKRGYLRSSMFSWKKMARETLGIYES